MESPLDTAEDAEEVRLRILRDMPPWRKVQLMASCIRSYGCPETR